MAELSDIELKKLIDAMQKTASSMGRINRAEKSKVKDINAEKTALDKLKKSTKEYGDRLLKFNGFLKKIEGGHIKAYEALSGSADNLLYSFHSLSKKFLEGLVVADAFEKMTEGARALTSEYNKLTNIGQTFGGSMIQMGLSAAQANLPMNQYIELLQRNSTLSAVLADNTSNTSFTLGKLSNSVRSTMKQFGFYGMTVQQVDDLTSDYAETLRLQGSTTLLNQNTTTQSVRRFAEDISNFAAVTGKAREEIAKETNSALQDPALMETNLSGGQYKNLTRATSFLASLPDGGQLSKMLTQTVGMGGVQFTQGAQSFLQAGMGQLLGPMQKIADEVQNGSLTKTSLVDFVKTMQNADSNPEIKELLRSQVRAGNESAAQVVQMLAGLRGINAEKFAQDNIREHKFTVFMNSLENALNTLTASFRAAFFATIQPIEKSFGKTGTLVTALNPMFTFLGHEIGKLVLFFLSPTMMNFYKEIPVYITEFINWIKGLPKEWNNIEKELKAKYKIIYDGLSMIGNLFKKVFDFSAKHPLEAGGALLGADLAKHLLGHFLGSLFTKHFSSMRVAARNVYINGKLTSLGKDGSMLKSLYNKIKGLGGKAAKTAEAAVAGDAAATAAGASTGATAATGAATVAGEVAATDAAVTASTGGIGFIPVVVASVLGLLGYASIKAFQTSIHNMNQKSYKDNIASNPYYRSRFGGAVMGLPPKTKTEIDHEKLVKQYQEVTDEIKKIKQIENDNKNMQSPTAVGLLQQMVALQKEQKELQAKLNGQVNTSNKMHEKTNNTMKKHVVMTPF